MSEHEANLPARTTVQRRLTLRGWTFRASCVCGRQMAWFMDRANRDAWVGEHENQRWCDR